MDARSRKETNDSLERGLGSQYESVFGAVIFPGLWPAELMCDVLFWS